MSTANSILIDATLSDGVRRRGTVLSLLLAGLGGLRRSVGTLRAGSATDAALSRCSDAQLADIGLSRSRLPAISAGAFFAD